MAKPDHFHGNFISSGIPYDSTAVTTFCNSNVYMQWYQRLNSSFKSIRYSGFWRDTWSGRQETYLSLYRKIYHPHIIDLSVGIVEIQYPSDVFREATWPQGTLLPQLPAYQGTCRQQ